MQISKAVKINYNSISSFPQIKLLLNKMVLKIILINYNKFYVNLHLNYPLIPILLYIFS